MLKNKLIPIIMNVNRKERELIFLRRECSESCLGKARQSEAMVLEGCCLFIDVIEKILMISDGKKCFLFI